MLWPSNAEPVVALACCLVHVQYDYMTRSLKDRMLRLQARHFHPLHSRPKLHGHATTGTQRAQHTSGLEKGAAHTTVLHQGAAHAAVLEQGAASSATNEQSADSHAETAGSALDGQSQLQSHATRLS